MQVIHPRDLLNLSWSCKEIRAFLMQKDAAFLWKHCLRAFKGLPPNPKHVIEPAWVTLMFTTYCTVRTYTGGELGCSDSGNSGEHGSIMKTFSQF